MILGSFDPFFGLFFNPWTAPFVANHVAGPDTYFRVFWMIPVPLLVAAVLTVIGYSLNDTIVVSGLIVNDTNDVDDGTCDAAHCSLREAINAAKAEASGPPS